MTIAKYIVLTEDKKEVSFFACGLENENSTFTGIIHEDMGDENYRSTLVIEDERISAEDDWDEQIEKFNSFSPVEFDMIEYSYTEELLHYNTDENVQNYCPFDEALKLFENGVLIENMDLLVPFGCRSALFEEKYKSVKTHTEELLEIKYILPGTIKAPKPKGFDEMISKERDEWAHGILSEKTDFELVKGTYNLEDNKNGADRSLQDANDVYDESPYVEAIASKCGEKLHYTTEVWNCYSEQLGQKGQIVGFTTFEELLEKADLITIDSGPYLHTWDNIDELLISAAYEEDGLVYEINIDKFEVFGIYKEGSAYKIVCEDKDYKVTLHTLGNL